MCVCVCVCVFVCSCLCMCGVWFHGLLISWLITCTFVLTVAFQFHSSVKTRLKVNSWHFPLNPLSYHTPAHTRTMLANTYLESMLAFISFHSSSFPNSHQSIDFRVPRDLDSGIPSRSGKSFQYGRRKSTILNEPSSSKSQENGETARCVHSLSQHVSRCIKGCIM